MHKLDVPAPHPEGTSHKSPSGHKRNKSKSDLYTAKAWWSVANALEALRPTLNQALVPVQRSNLLLSWVMDKTKKFGFAANDSKDINTTIKTAEKKRLISIIHNPYHVLRNYFQPPTTGWSGLRTQFHGFAFQKKTIDILYLGSYIDRVIRSMPYDAVH